SIFSFHPRSLKIPSHTEFEDPALNHPGRSAPRSAAGSGVGLILSRGGVRIQGVVNIEVRVYGVSFVYLENLCKPEVDLVEPIAESSVGIEHIHCFVASAA